MRYLLLALILTSTSHATKRTPAGLRNAYRNALLNLPARIRAARRVLPAWHRLTIRKIVAISKAHKVGSSGGGIKPDGTSNFTFGQLRRKTRILKHAGFTPSQIRTLFDHGIAGSSKYNLTINGARKSKMYLDALASAANRYDVRIHIKDTGTAGIYRHHFQVTASGDDRKVETFGRFLEALFE